MSVPLFGYQGYMIVCGNSVSSIAIEPMVSHPKGVSMEDCSQLAEIIVNQVADAVIYASRSGVIICWNRASTALFGSPQRMPYYAADVARYRRRPD
jgi:hypothetical protein